MNNKKIFVAVSCDDNFIETTAVMLKSISINTNSIISVYFLDDGISKYSKEFLLKNFENSNINLKFINININNPQTLKTNERIPIHTYYRLLIPELLSQDIEKIIYLDGDLILMDDIKKLWDYEIKDKALLAVRDMWIGTQYVSSEKGILSYKELNIPRKSIYFNAGVLVMNLKKWREKNYAEKIFEYLREYQEKVIYHDQDGMNAILWNDWIQLPEEWNVMGITFASDRNICCLNDEVYNRIKTNPKIVHFSGPFKPWNQECDIPYKKNYFMYKKYLI